MLREHENSLFKAWVLCLTIISPVALDHRPDYPFLCVQTNQSYFCDYFGTGFLKSGKINVESGSNIIKYSLRYYCVIEIYLKGKYRCKT